MLPVSEIVDARTFLSTQLRVSLQSLVDLRLFLLSTAYQSGIYNVKLFALLYIWTGVIV
jgi:hypothetical protein